MRTILIIITSIVIVGLIFWLGNYYEQNKVHSPVNSSSSTDSLKNDGYISPPEVINFSLLARKSLYNSQIN